MRIFVYVANTARALFGKAGVYMEQNPPTLRKFFKNSAVAKVLDFLTLYREFDYSLTEITKESGVAWTTLHRTWPLLEKYGLVIKTRQIGRAKLYKLNLKSDIVKALNEFAFQIAKFDARKLVEEETVFQGEEEQEMIEEPTSGEYPRDKTYSVATPRRIETVEQV